MSRESFATILLGIALADSLDGSSVFTLYPTDIYIYYILAVVLLTRVLEASPIS